MNAYVVRHGETEWNRAGRYQGQRESQLTEMGRAQAAAVARALEERGVRRIASSPLARCRDTAQPLAARIGVPVEIDNRLIEIAHGDWEGRLREDLERDDPSTMNLWREHPERVRFRGGETLADVLGRWRAFAATVPGTDDVAVFTHDVLVRLAILDATGGPISRLWEPRVANGGYARFAVERGRWTLAEGCVDEHLGDFFIDPAHQAL